MKERKGKGGVNWEMSEGRHKRTALKQKKLRKETKPLKGSARFDR